MSHLKLRQFVFRFFMALKSPFWPSRTSQKKLRKWRSVDFPVFPWFQSAKIRRGQLLFEQNFFFDFQTIYSGWSDRLIWVQNLKLRWTRKKRIKPFPELIFTKDVLNLDRTLHHEWSNIRKKTFFLFVYMISPPQIFTKNLLNLDWKIFYHQMASDFESIIPHLIFASWFTGHDILASE